MIKTTGKKCIWLLLCLMLWTMFVPAVSAGAVDASEHDSYVASLQNAGFPYSYCESLWALHCSYPSWQFEVYTPCLTWQEALQKETQLGVSLVSSTADSSWKSVQDGAYNYSTNSWVVLDSGGWVAASESIVAYYMDPRNLLDEDSIFQFLDQSFDSSLQSEDGLRRMVEGTYLSNESIDLGHPEGSTSYVHTLYTLCEANSVSPYVMASILIQEQGRNGDSASISGSHSRYPGIYNYFNIGAYATDTMTAVTRGLWYASGGNNASTTYDRPWNTRYLSLSGGISFYAKNYFSNGQTTLYLKRFNVQGMKPCTHQYMTNVSGATAEGKTLSRAYTGEARSEALVFRIPVYSGMPESACAKPGGSGSVNSKLAALSVSGVELTPAFDKDTLEYTAIVSADTASVTINAQPCDTSVIPAGTGEKALNTGLNDFIVSLTASNGSVTNYVLHISRRASEETASASEETPAPSEEAQSAVTGEQTPSPEPSTENVTVTETVSNAADRQKGDISGDGTVMINDLIRLRNHLLGTESLTGEALSAADVDGDGAVMINDLIRIRNYLLGNASLTP